MLPNVTIKINAFKLDAERHIWERRTDRTWLANQRRILSHPFYEGTLVKRVRENQASRQLVTTSLVRCAERMTDLLNVNGYNAVQLSAKSSASQRSDIATSDRVQCIVTTNALLSSAIRCRFFHIASLSHASPLMLNWIAGAAIKNGSQDADFVINVYVAVDEHISVSATSMQVASIIESLSHVNVIPQIKLNNERVLDDLITEPRSCGSNAARITQLLTRREFQFEISNASRSRCEQLSLPLTTDDERANLFADVTQAARELQSSIETKHPKYSFSAAATEVSDGTLELKIVFKLR